MPKFNATIKIGEANFEAEDMEDAKEKIRSADFKIEGTEVDHIDPKHTVLRQLQDKGNTSESGGDTE